MKKLFLVLMLIAPILSIAQGTFKFRVVSVVSGEPLAKKWFTILKNYDNYVDAAPTDKDGICTFTIRGYDSTASYQAEIINNATNTITSGLYDISAVKYSVPTISVKPAAFAMPFGCSDVSYMGYRARVPYSMNDLPLPIRQKVDEHFTERVGTQFYRNLTFNGGQMVNLQRFYSTNPIARQNGYIPPAYSLCFSILDSVTHDSYYTFQLKLDSSGSLIGPVPLPDIKHHPERAKIIGLDRAKAVAALAGFDKPWTEAKTAYYPKTEAIVWKFVQTEPGDGRKRSETLIIDAKTNKIIEKLTRYVTVMY